MSLCYLNGAYLPLEQARISPMDRGFLFGDGAYEVVPVYARRPFRLNAHLARLGRTLAAIGIADPHSRQGWRDIVTRLVAEHPLQDQAVYLQVSRGADKRRAHTFPDGAAPTVFGYSDALNGNTPEVLRDGVAVVSVSDFRWSRCDLKTTSLLANCLLRQHALEAGAAETILFRNGLLAEGASSNVFVVRDGVMLAPPRSHMMLSGITYEVVLELAARHGFEHQLREVREDEVRRADELWLTSSSKEVLPVTRLDGQPVGSGRPGPVHARMCACYQQLKREEG